MWVVFSAEKTTHGQTHEATKTSEKFHSHSFQKTISVLTKKCHVQHMRQQIVRSRTSTIFSCDSQEAQHIFAVSEVARFGRVALVVFQFLRFPESLIEKFVVETIFDFRQVCRSRVVIFFLRQRKRHTPAKRLWNDGFVRWVVCLLCGFAQAQKGERWRSISTFLRENLEKCGREF